MLITQDSTNALIEDFLRRDAGSHVYPLADLDEPFWSDTTWFVGFEAGSPRALCLLLEKVGLLQIGRATLIPRCPPQRALEPAFDASFD